MGRKNQTTRSLAEVAAHSARGLSLSEIAQLYNVSKQAIHKQIRRQKKDFIRLRSEARKALTNETTP